MQSMPGIKTEEIKTSNLKNAVESNNCIKRPCDQNQSKSPVDGGEI
jgi:hypothetical protein